MPVYAYKAAAAGTHGGGTVTADSPRHARDLLRARGLTITEIRPAQRARRRGLRPLRRGRESAETVRFVRELATLLGAGIPLLDGLRTLTRQHRGRFGVAVARLADEVAGGADLADAMSRSDGLFDELSVSIVRVGEHTGSLAAALNHLADYKEKSHRLRSRVTSALLYPAIVAMVGVAVSVFLMTKVVPDLLGLLVADGRDLPAVTRVVKACSDFLVAWWWALLLACGALVAGAVAVRRSAAGRVLIDRLVLRLPLVGDLVRKESTSRMAVVLAALLRSGLPFVEAVRVTRRTLSNRVFRRALGDYEAALASGRDIARPLEESGAFSPLVVQILAVGQQAGAEQLREMLRRMAESLDHQVEVATQRLTAALEPLLIVLLAVVVGAIALATVLPILEASNVL